MLLKKIENLKILVFGNKENTFLLYSFTCKIVNNQNNNRK